MGRMAYRIRMFFLGRNFVPGLFFYTKSLKPKKTKNFFQKTSVFPALINKHKIYQKF